MDATLHILRSLASTLIRQWPDLVGTFYGVLLGGLATLGIIRWQIGEERKERERLDQEFLGLLVEHVNREIAKNLRTLRDIVSALDQSEHPRLELWDWVVTIAESFASQAHDDLYRTGLQRYLPTGFGDEIRSANTIVFEVRHKVRQARAQHIFNASYIEGGEALNDELFAEMRSSLPDWLAGLERADRAVDPRHLPWIQAAASREKPPRWPRRRPIFRLRRHPTRKAQSAGTGA